MQILKVISVPCDENAVFGDGFSKVPSVRSGYSPLIFNDGHDIVSMGPKSRREIREILIQVESSHG